MDRDHLLTAIEAALASITHAHFFGTERGYQGQLLVALDRELPRHVLTPGSVVEQEYQKTLKVHGLKIRPDIIIHEPFDPRRHRARDEENIAVFELKRKATRRRAGDDFDALCDMMDELRYPLGVFINIASGQTRADCLPPRAQGRIVCFAVRYTPDGVSVSRD